MKCPEGWFCMLIFFGVVRFREIKYWAVIVLSLLLFYFLVTHSANNAISFVSINPFSFLVRYVHGPNTIVMPFYLKIIMYFVFHFVFVWWCFIAGFWKEGYGYFKGFEFQVIFSSLIPAIFISSTFEIAGGAVYYFSNVPTMVALGFVVANHMPWFYKVNVNILRAVVVSFSIITVWVVYKVSLLSETKNERPHVKGLPDIVNQLQELRGALAKNTIVEIKNKKILVDKIGCKAYWFLPAIIERPILDGLPNNDPCPNDGYYGLRDYIGKEPLIPKGFVVVQVELHP
jgi:hypothetical protein